MPGLLLFLNGNFINNEKRIQYKRDMYCKGKKEKEKEKKNQAANKAN